MDLYKYLWWQGNSNLDSVLAHFEDPIEELDRLLREEKISIHRADYGKVWISCPAFHKGNAVEQAIISSPGITAGELQKKLGLSRQQFYERINGLKLKKVKDGRKTRYYPLDGTHSPGGEPEDDYEPFEGTVEAFEATLNGFWLEQWELAKEGGDLKHCKDQVMAETLIEAAKHYGLRKKKLRRKT